MAPWIFSFPLFLLFISLQFCFWQFLFPVKISSSSQFQNEMEKEEIEIEKEQITAAAAATSSVPVITTTAYGKMREKRRTNERKKEKSIERCSTGFHASPERNTKMANNTWCENSFTKFLLYLHRMMMMVLVLMEVEVVTIELQIRARTHTTLLCDTHFSRTGKTDVPNWETWYWHSTWDLSKGKAKE